MSSPFVGSSSRMFYEDYSTMNINPTIEIGSTWEQALKIALNSEIETIGHYKKIQRKHLKTTWKQLSTGPKNKNFTVNRLLWPDIP